LKKKKNKLDGMGVGSVNEMGVKMRVWGLGSVVGC